MRDCCYDYALRFAFNFDFAIFNANGANFANVNQGIFFIRPFAKFAMMN